MDGNLAVEVIKQKFERVDRKVTIPLQNGRAFKASMINEGIVVDNLGNQPLLPWVIFEEVINLLVRNRGRAQKGNAMDSKLGEKGLSLDSIEGHIAVAVYGKKPGNSVFRRISPIAAILVWSGLCDSEPGELVLR